MRIAGSTVRRGYLKRYEKTYSDKYDSERKIQSGRKFLRSSESPIEAAQALRVRKSIAEVETYQENLKAANSIYTNAESSMLTVSGILQTVYEKLVEGAHGTRNQDDCNIIALEIDNHAEEMVQSFNIDVADRKLFGGLNNNTVAFAIETGAGGDKFVTYNGVAVNSSSDPTDFPYDGVSYLDVGIGMSTDGMINRIDDQTALPITFNGVECTGCGVTNRTAMIDLQSIIPGNAYKLNVSAGGVSKTIEFIGGDTDRDSVENINEALRQAFKSTPEIDDTGKISYLENIPGVETPKVANYKNASINGTPAVDLSAIEEGSWYSLEITANGKTRAIDFEGSGNSITDLDTIRKALNEQFGEEDAPKIYSDGAFIQADGTPAEVKNCGNYSNDVNIGADNSLDLASMTAGQQYSINVCGTKVTFTAGADPTETAKNINKSFERTSVFGEPNVPYVNQSGTLLYDKEGASIIISNAPGADNQLEYADLKGYSKNIIQLTLDAAKALRDGDQRLVARYADLIFAAQSSLSISIADLGTHSKFIEFTQDRLSSTLINLQERQNDLEITDLPEEITNWKVLESVYNASLQMGSSVLSQSIFDYIK